MRIAAGSRALGGFALGASAGLALGYVAATACTGGDRCDGGVLLVPLGGIFGGFLGATIGYLTAYKWQPVPPGQ